MSSTPLTYFAFRTYASAAPSTTAGFNTYSSFNTFWFWLSYRGTSTEELIQYYANLLILQYLEQPKAYEMVESIVTPVIMDQLPSQVQNAFNLTGTSIAVGAQLDIIGKYVGVTRSGSGFYSAITLDDANFLLLIQMGIIRNSSSSSLAAIQLLLNQFFSGEIYVFDYQNMNMSYLIDSDIGSQGLIQLFVTEKLLPRPMGVGISVIANPIVNKFFGLRTYQAVASPITTPLNSYVAYDTTWLVMSYKYAIVV